MVKAKVVPTPFYAGEEIHLNMAQAAAATSTMEVLDFSTEKNEWLTL